MTRVGHTQLRNSTGFNNFKSVTCVCLNEMFSTGPTDSIRANSKVVGQQSGCIADRYRRTKETEVPQTYHVDTSVATGRFQRNDQSLFGRCSHAQTPVQHNG